MGADRPLGEREIDALPCGERPAHADIGRGHRGWQGRDKDDGDRKCDFRAKEIGCIFQKPMLMPYLTVFENLRLSASIAGKTLTREEAECLLASVGLSEYAPRKADALSGGEAQRVAFLRAILRKPAVLLADEPTASLDRANSELIVEKLLQYQYESGCLLLCATHDEKVQARFANRLVLGK